MDNEFEGSEYYISSLNEVNSAEEYIKKVLGISEIPDGFIRDICAKVRDAYLKGIEHERKGKFVTNLETPTIIDHYQGRVVSVGENRVAVLYAVNDNYVEQEYEKKQFVKGVLPKQNDIIDIHVVAKVIKKGD